MAKRFALWSIAVFEPLLAALPIEVADVLHAASTRARPIWVVGGTVRDVLLGRIPTDIDLASAWLVEEFVALLPAGLPIERNAELGACTVRIGSVDVVHTTFRVESEYGRDRRPRQVRFETDLAVDALRRDFTVNAIYVDVVARECRDPTLGRVDLAAARLRVIGAARTRFTEDPLRILRGVRFEAEHGLSLEPATYAAMAECADQLARLVVARQYDELRGILAARDWRRGIDRLIDLGALEVLLPELATQLAPLRDRLECCAPGVEVPARWVALLGSGERAIAALERLSAPRADRRAIAAMG